MDTDDLPSPPYSADLLSDLHAGVLPQAVSTRLWPRVREDREAMRIIQSLDAVERRLSDLGDDHTVESPIPTHVASRIDAALLSASTSADGDSGNVIRFPRRRRAWALTAAGAATAAAVAVVIAVMVIPKPPEHEETIAQPSSTSEHTIDLDFTAEPEPGKMMALVGSRNLGPLENPETLADCLQANGIDRSKPVLGSGQVQVRGQSGTALLLAGPQPPQITALVVGNGCGAGSPETISRDDIG
ncbi:hypothetical protein [Rhodococcus sp. NPDC058521]|uniref:hypothetical protein n=1 Tax=Rhodococcus sp. NPDC058521 TaxID=3346536 RepID=UPI003650569C